ncbi:hypothetical protein [Amycolatopsis sp. NPDC051071]|uniref:hypothetical protein n=1 Tax=Amycolatopsis sp. NPDC051071 TaxID=3154637 RepID=UPI00343CD966
MNTLYAGEIMPPLKTLLGVLLAAGLLAGCSPAPPRDDRGSQSAPTPEEAFRFGGISMPASGKVLKTEYEKGIDAMYRVDLTLPPNDLPELLKASNFAPGVTEDDQLVDGRRVYRKVTIDGTTVHLELFTM